MIFPSLTSIPPFNCGVVIVSILGALTSMPSPMEGTGTTSSGILNGMSFGLCISFLLTFNSSSNGRVIRSTSPFLLLGNDSFILSSTPLIVGMVIATSFASISG